MILSLPDDSALGEDAPLCPVEVPASKSATNRALLLAALAPGESRLAGGLEAEDTRWMRQALRECGVAVEATPGLWTIHGGTRPRASSPLFLGASGTSLRFLLPWLAIHGEGPFQLTGDPRLFERPLGPLEAVLGTLGARLHRTASGLNLEPVPAWPEALDLDLEVDAALSSQFLTGLALALAGLPGTSRLRWETAASPSYLRLTALWLTRFGCASRLDEQHWEISGGLRPATLRLPLDWSGAAAFYAAAAVTGRSLTLGPWDPEDEQGDRRVLDILSDAGCAVTIRPASEGQAITVEGPLRSGLHADLHLCPDLGPVLAAVAAVAPGPSRLTGLETLRLKECDRLDASADLVRWLRGHAEIQGDHTLLIAPGGEAAPDRPPFDPRNDHRMAFAAAVGALRRGGSVADPDCVAKTFPGFWQAWAGMLGC